MPCMAGQGAGRTAESGRRATRRSVPGRQTLVRRCPCLVVVQIPKHLTAWPGNGIRIPFQNVRRRQALQQAEHGNPMSASRDPDTHRAGYLKPSLLIQY